MWIVNKSLKRIIAPIVSRWYIICTHIKILPMSSTIWSYNISIFPYFFYNCNMSVVFRGSLKQMTAPNSGVCPLWYPSCVYPHQSPSISSRKCRSIYIFYIRIWTLPKSSPCISRTIWQSIAVLSKMDFYYTNMDCLAYHLSLFLA